MRRSFCDLGENVKVKLDLSNYTTMADLKNATRVDTSVFAKKNDLANLISDIDNLDLSNLKSKVDKSEADKLVPANVGLSKLSDVVKNDFV